MRTFGLIGYPLGHSFSKKYFTEQFQREKITDSSYELFPLENINEIAGLLDTQSGLKGLNVTIPYKLQVMPFLDELDLAAEKIGAVNCISITESAGKRHLKGYNTDAYGFECSIKPFLQPHHTHALILGDGGAAQAVKYVLDNLGVSWKSVLRKPAEHALLYSDLNAELMNQYQIIINTTPLGTFPAIETAPEIPYEFLTGEHLAYDLVYNPEITTFLRLAAEKGAAIKNGKEMLELQADRSWYIWNN
ncbi:shikimate dehydrogenase family protein [Pedobacter antarcticus]|uniref:shikimate dehydrogenase family protein n=1 Tax=Pedobacter antarcticus TaxID=34086 RepID=UPI001C581859|nr:shikimate dehydrogenase [Pedobacter antarcticus]